MCVVVWCGCGCVGGGCRLGWVGAWRERAREGEEWMSGWMSKLVWSEALVSLPLCWDLRLSGGIDWEVRSVSSVRSVGMAVALGVGAREGEIGAGGNGKGLELSNFLRHPDPAVCTGTGWTGRDWMGWMGG